MLVTTNNVSGLCVNLYGRYLTCDTNIKINAFDI